MKNIQRFTLILLSIITCFATTFAYAKSINLQEQPTANAKVVGSIDSETGIIPIFTPKGSDWIKVADPRNGDVGWIKLSDLGGAAGAGTNVTLTQKIITSGKVPHTVQIIQFGTPGKLTPEQEKIMTQMKAQQEALQKDIQKMMNDMFKNSNQEWAHFPMVIPVIVVPEQKISTTPATSTTK